MKAPRIARLVAAALLAGVVTLPISMAEAAPAVPARSVKISPVRGPQLPIGQPIVRPLSEGPWP